MGTNCSLSFPHNLLEWYLVWSSAATAPLLLYLQKYSSAYFGCIKWLFSLLMLSFQPEAIGYFPLTSENSTFSPRELLQTGCIL